MVFQGFLYGLFVAFAIGLADLLAVVRPGLDGLLLREGSRRGTLLPSVWETLAEPHVFLRELKVKAGFRADYWSENIEVFRYTTESFS